MKMYNNKEIELKLLVTKANLKKFLALDYVAPHIRPDSKTTKTLITTYYDTEDMNFKAHCLAYRVRDKGDGTYEATVKAGTKSMGGLSERTELNLQLTSNTPVLEGFLALGLPYELTELAPNGVKPLFTVKVERTTYMLDLGGAVVELAIDKGRITAGRAKDQIDEIELELVDGDIRILLAFIARVAGDIPLFAEKRSKYLRGLALLGMSVTPVEMLPPMSRGPAREAMIDLVEFHGDILLELQNELNKGALTDDLSKQLRRRLLFMRTCASMVHALTGAPWAEKKLFDKALAAAERVRSLRRLQQIWTNLSLAGERFLGRSTMARRLATLSIEADEAVHRLTAAGTFTAIYYGLLRWLYCTEWTRDGSSAELAAKNCVRIWQNEKNAAPNLADVEALTQNILLLSRSMKGKFFAKAIESAKKGRRRLHKRVVAERWQHILAEIAASTTSKAVHRDVGFILGWLVARRGI